VKNFTRNILFGLSSVLILASLTMPASAQLNNHLVMMKKGNLSKVRFLSGDPIAFIRYGSTDVEDYYIQGIGEDFIVVAGQPVPLKKITCLVQTRKGFNFRSSGQALIAAAPGYLIIGAINSLFAGVSLVPSKTSLIVAGSFLTTGAILPLFQTKKYPIGKKYRLLIVPADPALNK